MTITIEHSIQRILRTTFGERMGNPAFGSRLNDLIDRPATVGWRVDAQRYVREALKQDNRFKVTNVEVLVQTKGVTIKVEYTIKETKTVETIEVTL